MKYVAITTDEMLQGEGLRVALWVSGCSLKCDGCHNKEYWDKDFGKVYDEEDVMNQIRKELDKDYIAGLTILGGNPTEIYNLSEVCLLCKRVKMEYPDKTIWLYSGHTYEYLKNLELLKYVDVLVDGPFIKELADENYPWAGSTNQRVIRLSDPTLGFRWKDLG